MGEIADRRERRVAPAALALVVFLGHVAGCRGSGDRIETPTLPFHVALAPIALDERQSLLQESRSQQTTFAIEFDEQILSEALQRLLQEQCFAKVTLLQYPEPPTRFRRRGARARDEAWAQEAERVHADLLLVSDLSYAPPVANDSNGMFWWNFALFSAGGPFCYFVEDRTYSADAQLSGTIYELSPVFDGQVSIQHERTRLQTLSSKPAGVSLNFLDRAGTLSYPVSLLIPAGLLARDSERAGKAVNRKYGEALIAEIRNQILTRSELLVEAQDKANFFVDTGSIRIRRLDDDRIQLTGEAILLRDADVDALDEYEILMDGAVVARGDFDAPVVDDALSTPEKEYLRYRIDQIFESPDTVDGIQLRMWDGSGNRNVRSYTFPLNWNSTGPGPS